MTAIVTNPRERTRFLRFMVVGAFGAIVDFGTANLIVYIFSAPLVLAGTISFIAAILSNFSWNRFWTYPDSRSKPLVQQLVQFTIVSVVGLGIRVPILHWLEPLFYRLVGQLRLPPGAISLLVKNLTLAVAVLIVMLWNFFANRYWTYSDVE